jgi:hypothetical protein
MFVSGFTIARNVVQADYPIKEAIYSILPLCDEVVVAVAKSDDNTLEYIKSFDSDKIRIIETVWDDSLREGGKVLAVETNKALDAVSPEADWCVYIQADECLHEKDYDTMGKAMYSYLKNEEVEGFLFNYRHFYGSYDYLGDSRNWYRNEIRIVRNKKGVRSYKDAQGFRIDDRKLKVKALGAHVHHYGWVKHPELQLVKVKQANKLWHSDDYIEDKFKGDEFDYSNIDSINKFNDSHPAVMQERIRKQNWEFDHDISRKNFSFKKRLLYWFEKKTGIRIGEYKNYDLV